MLKNDEIANLAGMKCREIATATAARGFNRDFQLMFMDLWAFDYKKNVNNIYSGTILINGYNAAKKNLELFHGVYIEKNDIVSKNHYLDFIIENIKQERPINIDFDQAYLPWAKEIRKKAPLRYSGNILMMGVELNKKIINCIDIHGTHVFEKLPFGNFMEYAYSIKNINFYVYNKKEISEKFDLKKHINTTMNRIYCADNNMFDNIMRFTCDLKDDFIFEKEIEYSKSLIGDLPSPTWIIFIDDLINVARMRILYSYSLEYMGAICKNPKLSKLGDEFKLLWGKWQILISILIKAYYTKKYRKLNYNLVNKLCEIVELENRLADQLEKSVLEKSIYSNNILKDREIEKKITTQVVNVNIVDLLNNKAICFEKDEIKNANFDSLNNFYLMDKIPNVDDLVDGICNYKIIVDKADNIICLGQSIIVDVEDAKAIYFLGACHSGAYYGKFIIYFEDGSSQESILGFGEWRFNKSDMGERVVCTCNRSYFEKVIDEEKGYLFSNSSHIVDNGKIVKIELPYCENMHIFAISILI